MSSVVDFEIATAHKFFSAECFNRAWDLIDKENRTEEEDRLMVALNQASLYHWLQRPDCDNLRLSIGFWQSARIHAILGQAAEAMRQAKVCLSYSQDLPPFYQGYAYEALARACLVNHDKKHASAYLAQAMSLADEVADQAEKDLLVADLISIREQLVRD